MNKRDEMIKKACIDALKIDGGHHKQWYLEKVLIYLGMSMKEIRKEIGDYEEGITP